MTKWVKSITEKFKETFSKNIVEDYPELNDYNEDLKKIKSEE